MRLKNLSLAAVAVSMCVMVSCHRSCEVELNPHEAIVQYFTKDMVQPAEGMDKWAVYFDFSDGMQHAYAPEATREVVRDVVQKLTGSSARFDMYSLADDTIKQLPVKINDLFNTIVDAKSYAHQQAPIEKALKKIVGEGRSAIMVTDFEEYTPDKRIQNSPFATPYFRTWLQRGGDITFYVTPFKEGSKDKWLYYIVFDNARHDLLAFFEDGLKSATPNYRRFHLSTHPYDVKTSYLSASKGGTFHDPDGEDFVTSSVEDGSDDSFCAFPALKMEYYNFDATWPDIVVNAKDQSDSELPSKERFKHLLSGASIDLSNTDSYRVKALDLRVLDVTEDYGRFAKWLKAKACPPEKDEDGEWIATDYYDEKGQMRPEYVYTAPDLVPQVPDMLVFNKEAFEGVADASAKPIAIDFNPGFGGTMAGGKVPQMLRVDVVIAQAEPCTENLDELFAWKGNDNLASSIRNVLQELRPEGTPVYTYFIKTNEE